MGVFDIERQWDGVRISKGDYRRAQRLLTGEAQGRPVNWSRESAPVRGAARDILAVQRKRGWWNR